MSTVEGVELRWVEMPLRSPFQTSFGIETVKQVLLLRMVTSAGEGWGECVSSEAPLYSSEFNASSAAVIRDYLVPALGGGLDVTPAGVGAALRPFKGHRMAKGAVEMAFLDAELRGAGMSLASYLGSTRDPCAVRGLGRDHGRHPHPAEGRDRLPGRGLRPDQAEDPARLGPRAGPGRAGRDRRRRPVAGRCEHGVHAARRAPARPAGRVRPAAGRAAAGGRGPHRARDAGPADPDADLPGRVDRQREGRGGRDPARGVLGGEHQAGPRGWLSRGPPGARRLPRQRRAGLVRRHAGDRARAGGQHGGRGPPRLHADRRRLGVRPVLPAGHHRANRVAGRADRRADGDQGSASTCCPTSWTRSRSARSGSRPRRSARPPSRR